MIPEQQYKEIEELFKVQKILYKSYTKGYKQLQIDFGMWKGITKNIINEIFQRIKFPKLRKLTLLSMPFQDKLVDMLLFFQFEKLELIDLRNSYIGQAGINKLLEIKWPALKDINLTENNIGDEGFQIFLLSSHIHSKLEKLSLASNGITSKGFRGIYSANFTNLKVLFLCGNKVGKRGVQYLVKWDLSKLEELNLDYCKLNNQSIKHLHKAQWPRLKVIFLSQNQFKFRFQQRCNSKQSDPSLRCQLETRKILDILFQKGIYPLLLECSQNINQVAENLNKVIQYIQQNEMFEGIEALISANVMLTRIMQY